jgi:hypothetical protein
MNFRTCLNGAPSIEGALRILAVLLVLGAPADAWAQFAGQASATGQFESDSNVFSLDSGASQISTNGSAPSDTFFAYGAKLDGKYLWGLQSFSASFGANEYKYQRFTELDHDAYSFDGGWKWKANSILDGSLDVARQRSMVQFQDLRIDQTSLSVQTVQRESGLFNLKATSHWQIQGSAYTSQLEQPNQGAPDLKLTESGTTAGLRYVGFTGFTSGVTAGYITGSYQGAVTTGTTGTSINPTYHQYNEGLTATYQSVRSTFDGQIGYSRRSSSAGTDETGGLTGALSFTEKLSSKTSFRLNLSRAIENYIANSGSEIDTSAGGNVSWQATYKLGVSLGYSYTHASFPAQGTDPSVSDRVDHAQNATFSLNYEPRRWLLIKPYANYSTRSSNVLGGDYNATSFGVSVTVQTLDGGK